MTTADDSSLNKPVTIRASSKTVALTAAPPIFLPTDVRGLLLLLVLALLPFQVWGVDVGTSKWDLANLVFVAFVASIGFGNGRAPLSGFFKAFFGIYIVIQIVSFFAHGTPPARFASGFLWMTSIIVLFGRRTQVPLDASLAYRVILAGVVLMCTVLLYQLLWLRIDRPAGTMAEPSPAGLVALAAGAGLIVSAKWATPSERWIGYAAALGFTFISFIIKTTHIISFAIALIVVGIVSRAFTLRTLAIVAPLLGVLYWFVTNDAHYTSRVDVYNASSNLSLLSWLQGFDQMVASLRRYPVIGAGLGGTGQFDFYSSYSEELFRAGIGDLNRLDAYSGFFRLTIELGPIVAGIMLLVLGGRLVEMWHATGDGRLPLTEESKHQVFLFTFSVTLLAGILLKEPTYSRSQFVVSMLLFCTVPLRATITLPGSVARHFGMIAARPAGPQVDGPRERVAV
ncbi:hypothetical protein [Sphingomonas sp.]|uniref:hypothetical protein n=1 Tax=Sphingomonas sp. TaxID=28214 RepID=UPI003CC65EA1